MTRASILLALPALALAAAPHAQEARRGDATCENALLEAAKTHYAHVSEELRARDVGALAPEQRARRAALLDELDRYRAAGDFTRWLAPEERVPVFVDADGRHCAVANLLRFTGETALVASVEAADNHAWVWDLRGAPEFQAWLARHGLGFDEAARIQLPASGGGGGSFAPPPPPALPGRYAGPGSGGGSDSPGTPGGPTTGGAPAPATPRSLPGMPRTAERPTAPETLGGEAFTDWGLWWEFNKLTWLRPRPLSAFGGRSDGATQSESALGAARRAARDRLARELASPIAAVRAAAAVAFARAAGPAACDALKPMLDDPARDVRMAALVGLAATGGEEGVHALLAIIHAEDEPAPGLRAAAIVALGAAAAEGQGRGVGAMLPSLVPDLDADETFAILIYAELAHDDGLAAFARERSGLFERRRGRGLDAFAAGRAIEALSLQQPEAVLSQVLDAANGRELDARRGALNALGELAGALEPLMTACEGEHDPLARGYALLAIGRHGGEAARAFLVRELERGQAAMRPWSALALGVLAEGDDDALARAALRDAHAKEKVRTSRAAYLLAFGISRDVDAEGILRDALAAKDSSTRFYAAQGLGLLLTTRGREALRTALPHEETPLVRTALAQALALQGNALDVEMLLGELDRAKNPLLRGQIAAALGLFGHRLAIDGLLARLDGQALGAESRAAALGALAIGLSGRDRITLGGASAWSNHAAFPGWLLELLQQPM